ncbi:MAG: Wzz/FepE/Etk N-terminal domain-containing protein [Terracidiphilus sp.]|nr:Wzz/FepE/Etk N-terminal domain-containing protein [Terracidiphilus sp.]
MSTAEEQDQIVAEGATAPMEISIVELWMAIWQHRLCMAKVIGLGTLVAIGIALLIPNQYTSTAQLMPPDQQALSGTSVLSVLSGTSAMMPSLSGGLMNAKTPGGLPISILQSRTAQDDIINRFDLRRVYRCKLYVDARKKLAKRSKFEEDKKSGIIIINVTDSDPNRARNIAKAYVEELDKLLSTLSTSSARRERIFLEERLKSIKRDLDASSNELSQFSSRNATLDYQKQGAATMEAATKLQGEFIAAQSELSGLRATYTDDNMRVRQARARVGVLLSQLKKMGGAGEDADKGDLNAGEFMPSIRKLPLLGVTYADLYRRVQMQEAIYETLSRQYEMAKVQEAKEIPPIKVLDEPQVPEIKSFPHRMTIIIFGTLVAAFAGIVWIIARKIWDLIRNSYPAKEA